MDDETAGDPAGWVDRHGDSLYRYALLRLGDPDRAADLVQETFLHALRSAREFEGRSAERTWLVGILKHKVVDQWRATGRRDAATTRLAAEEQAGSEFDRSGRWRLGPTRWAGGPGRDAETREFWDAFRSCLGQLSPTLADAFLLREIDGLAADEVQAQLGITPANLWARLHRARSLLRRCLEIHWFGHEDDSPPLASPRAATTHGKARSCDGPTH